MAPGNLEGLMVPRGVWCSLGLTEWGACCVPREWWREGHQEEAERDLSSPLRPEQLHCHLFTCHGSAKDFI